MLEQLFIEIYDKFKLNFYKNIFKGFTKKNDTLTVTESFCLEVIYSLKNPTISELSKYLGISQPNTTYKVNELIRKGYVIKDQDCNDRRRVKLYPTELFSKYYDTKNEYVSTIVKRMYGRFSDEEIKTVEKVLYAMSQELMPEVSEKK